jgi:hypothetical protein
MTNTETEMHVMVLHDITSHFRAKSLLDSQVMYSAGQCGHTE